HMQLLATVAGATGSLGGIRLAVLGFVGGRARFGAGGGGRRGRCRRCRGGRRRRRGRRGRGAGLLALGLVTLALFLHAAGFLGLAHPLLLVFDAAAVFLVEPLLLAPLGLGLLDLGLLRGLEFALALLGLLGLGARLLLEHIALHIGAFH